MKRLFTVMILLTALTFSCHRVKEKTKETINKGGEVVGKTATEFIEGVSEGVDKTLECNIILSKVLMEKGLRTGKFSIENDSVGGKNNRLVLYLIFDKDIKTRLLVRAFDKAGIEIGRTKIEIAGKAGDAGYYDLIFDKRTYIEVRSRIEIDEI